MPLASESFITEACGKFYPVLVVQYHKKEWVLICRKVLFWNSSLLESQGFTRSEALTFIIGCGGFRTADKKCGSESASPGIDFSSN
jgi:hypothetical protein